MDAELKKVDLTTTEIELPKLDVSKYIGKRAKIERCEEFEGAHGYFVRIETEPLDTIGTGDRKIPIRASAVFGLQTDEAGNVGWGKKTKLGIFLQKMNAPHYRDLIGRDVIVQTRTSKAGVDYATF